MEAPVGVVLILLLLMFAVVTRVNSDEPVVVVIQRSAPNGEGCLPAIVLILALLLALLFIVF